MKKAEESNLSVVSGSSLQSVNRTKSAGQIDYKQLEDLYEHFVSRWRGQDHGLTREEFCEAMKTSVGYHMDEEELDTIFSKVDSEGTGLLKWSQFIASLSQTEVLRSEMAARAIKPLFCEKMEFLNTQLRDEIIAIRFIPRLSLQSTKINYNRGRYLMLSRLGNLTMWSINLQLIGTYSVASSEGRGRSMMFYLDLVVLYPSTMIAVASADRKITLFELGSRGIKQKYTIVSINNCLTCMDYWADLHSRTFSLLVWGDTGGDIHALEMNISRLGGIFDKDENREIITRVMYSDLLKNKISTVYLHKVSGVHQGWVTAVRYIPENRAFLSSSSSTAKSLCYSDWYGKAETRYYQSRKSVLCFDFNFVIHLVVTGCLDCQVRVWNFFMGSRPILTFRGHSSPVNHVMLNPSSQHVISMDKAHAIKIFDYREGSIVQSFSGPSLSIMGHNPIEGFFFNRARCQLIIATYVVGFTSRHVNPPSMAEVAAHEYPITAVCYSSAFEEIITACANACISVWDLRTGKHMLEFQHFSARTKCRNVPWEPNDNRLEVTTMTLGSTERRALTGANDGTVNVWNFSSGVLLAHYTLPEETLVTGLAVDRNTLYATGWSRHVYTMDLMEKGAYRNYKAFKRYHREDINCISLLKGGLIATGSYDGDIIILTRDTGQGRCRINAGTSQFPIPLISTHEEVDPSTLGKGGEDEEEPYDGEQSGEMFFTTEDGTTVRGIRVSRSRVFIPNPVTGGWRIVRHPLVERKPSLTGMVYDVYKGAKVTLEESAQSFRSFENSVDVLLCLETRKHYDCYTANVLTAGSEGWIRAWSLHPKGGLRGQFLATVHLGESVKALTTDDENQFLITADTMGYVKVWDMFMYCNAAVRQMTDDEKQERRELWCRTFYYYRSAFLRDDAAEGFERCEKYNKRKPPKETQPHVTLKTPKLLNVFRTHTQAITGIQYVNKHHLIITGSRDCSVRIWTITGSFVGQCGNPWHRIAEDYTQMPLRTLPRDILRNASARTFRVIKGGKAPAWDRAVKLIRNYIEEERKEEQIRQTAKQKAGEETMEGDAMRDAEAWMAQPVLMDRDESTVRPELRLSNVVKFGWKDPQKSRILGKSFKPDLHHRKLEYTPKINPKADFGQIAAFRQLPIREISKVTAIPTPQIIIEMEQLRRQEEEDAQYYRDLLKPKKSSRIKRGSSRCSCATPTRSGSVGMGYRGKNTKEAGCSSKKGSKPSSNLTSLASSVSKVNYNTSCSNRAQRAGEDCRTKHSDGSKKATGTVESVRTRNQTGNNKAANVLEERLHVNSTERKKGLGQGKNKAEPGKAKTNNSSTVSKVAGRRGTKTIASNNSGDMYDQFITAVEKENTTTVQCPQGPIDNRNNCFDVARDGSSHGHFILPHLSEALPPDNSLIGATSRLTRRTPSGSVRKGRVRFDDSDYAIAKRNEASAISRLNDSLPDSDEDSIYDDYAERASTRASQCILPAVHSAKREFLSSQKTAPAVSPTPTMLPSIEKISAVDLKDAVRAKLFKGTGLVFGPWASSPRRMHFK